MAFTNYDELIKEVIDWSHRGDLGNKIESFISLAENAMYSNDVEVLTIRSTETITTSLTDAQKIQLPADYESFRSVRLVTSDNGGELRFQAPEQLSRDVAQGRPTSFSIIGDQIEFNRTPDSEYTIEFQYYKKATPLSLTNQTNEILTNHPSLYLFGALVALFAFAQDDEQAAKYSSLFIGALKGANKADKKGRYGPAPAMTIDRGMIV